MSLNLSGLSWRQLGFQLEEAMNGSDPYKQRYYDLLCEAERRVKGDKAAIRPDEPPEETTGNPVSSPDDTPTLDGGVALVEPVIEKVADMTHRGAGL